MSIETTVQGVLGHPGRLLSGSKSGYRTKYPDNKVFFNSNLIVEGHGKVWYGDIDVTRDHEKLQDLATTLGKQVLVVSELDGRFENENKTWQYYKSCAKWSSI